jgi:hypothetical protein
MVRQIRLIVVSKTVVQIEPGSNPPPILPVETYDMVIPRVISIKRRRLARIAKSNRSPEQRQLQDVVKSAE